MKPGTAETAVTLPSANLSQITNADVAVNTHNKNLIDSNPAGRICCIGAPNGQLPAAVAGTETTRAEKDMSLLCRYGRLRNLTARVMQVINPD